MCARVAPFGGCPPRWAEAQLENAPTYLRTEHTRVGLWEAGIPHCISGARKKRPGEGPGAPNLSPLTVTQTTASPVTAIGQLSTERPDAPSRGGWEDTGITAVDTRPGGRQWPCIHAERGWSSRRAAPPAASPPPPSLPGKERASAGPIWKALRPDGSISSAIITNPSGDASSKMKSLCQNFHYGGDAARGSAYTEPASPRWRPDSRPARSLPPWSLHTPENPPPAAVSKRQ